MTEIIKLYLPWIVSAITIWAMIQQGNKHPKAWLWSLGNQVLWLTWIVADKAWGMLPLTAFMTVLSIRNHLKWNRHES